MNDCFVTFFSSYLSFPSPDSTTRHSYTSNASILSLRNNEGVTPFKSIVAIPKRAIDRSSGYGPTFGRGWDITFSVNAVTLIYTHSLASPALLQLEYKAVKSLSITHFYFAS